MVAWCNSWKFCTSVQPSHGIPPQGADGVLVPGGFGDRGVQGKILAAKYARENNVPYLGICLGMQIAVIEFARSVMKLQGANSTEFDPATTSPCVIFMPEVGYVHCHAYLVLLSFINHSFWTVNFWQHFHRAQKPKWERQWGLDRGEPISMSMAANLQSCKKTLILIFFSLMHDCTLDVVKYNCCKYGEI